MQPPNKKIALVYDADKTILSEDHPNIILRARGIKPHEFWEEVDAIQDKHKERYPDSNLDGFYLRYMLDRSLEAQDPLHNLSIEEMEKLGEEHLHEIYYPGIPEFFTRIKQENPEVEIHNSIVSLGIHNLLRPLEKHVDRIFAYTIIKGRYGRLIVAGTTSSLEKGTATKKISRGRYFGTETRGFEYPMEDMIVIGDGFSDEEMFKQVAPKGLAICVYNPDPAKREEGIKRASKIQSRIKGLEIAPADYQVGSDLWKIVNEKIREER